MYQLSPPKANPASRHLVCHSRRESAFALCFSSCRDLLLFLGLCLCFRDRSRLQPRHPQTLQNLGFSPRDFISCTAANRAPLYWNPLARPKANSPTGPARTSLPGRPRRRHPLLRLRPPVPLAPHPPGLLRRLRRRLQQQASHPRPRAPVHHHPGLDLALASDRVPQVRGSPPRLCSGGWRSRF